jgi:HlyD family secretion protein
VGVGLVGGWAALVPLSGAVVVPGTLVAETSVKKVQHPTGGVVKEILVREGTHVDAGDLVVRLDETQARANLQVVTKQLDDLRARLARLTAERDGIAEPQMAREVADHPDSKEAEQVFTAEKGLFKARTSARQSQTQLLRGRVNQLSEEISGLNAQLKSKASQIESIASEQQAVQGLYDKHLVPMTRLTSLQREAARIEGERGQIVSSIAETQAKISEAELQIVRADQDFRTEVIKDLREAQGKMAELSEKSVAAQDQLNRIEIRAPTSGVVNQLAIHTLGGVISPAEVLMTIVPEADDLQIEAHLPTQNINEVRRGQDALIKLSAFNQRTTPELSGTVSLVSADATHDANSPNGPLFYTVRVTLAKEEIDRLAGLQLVSGMPAEVFLKTGSRTMLSYLFKPLTDQLTRTFNER